MRAFALEQAERRCECTGSNCRHHLSGARCRRGLRDDRWKVYWRSESQGVTRENLEAWCLECFENNFDVPREQVALLAADISGYARLLEHDYRRAITLKSVLRDAAQRAAEARRGRVVLARLDDDVLLEFPKIAYAAECAREVHSGFTDLAERLNLSAPPIRGVIHYGDVVRWRSGFLAGDAVRVTSELMSQALAGVVVVTEAAAQGIGRKATLEPLNERGTDDGPEAESLWSLVL